MPLTVIFWNKGDKEWRATISPQTPWIDILSDHSFVLPGGVKRTIIVALNDKWPTGNSTVLEALTINGDGKSIRIGVKATLKPPAPDVVISPNQIDFGKLDSPNSTHEQTIVFGNRGNSEWSGMVRTSVPWLEITPVSNGQLICPPKSECFITFRLTGEPPEGRQNLSSAVIFEGPGGPYVLSLKFEYYPVPRPRSVPIDFGLILDPSSVSGVVNPVYNDGYKDWENVKVSINVPWITVKPNALQVPKRGRSEINVRLNEAVYSLPGGTYYQADALVLSGTGFQLPIGIKLILPAPDLQALDESRTEILKITFSLLEYADRAPRLERKIVVHNSGNRTWAGKIESLARWLKVEPEMATIEAGRDTDILVQITENIKDMELGGSFIRKDYSI